MNTPASQPTPQAPKRHVKGAPDTTKPATLDALPSRTPTHAVQGPAQLANGHKPMSVPAGPPPLHGTAPASVKPKEQR